VLELALNNLANPREFLFKCTRKARRFTFEYCCRLISSTDQNKIYYITHVWHSKLFKNDRGVMQPDIVASLSTIYLSSKGNVERRAFCERRQKAIPTSIDFPTNFMSQNVSSSQEFPPFHIDLKIVASERADKPWLLDREKLIIGSDWTQFQPVLTDELFDGMKLPSTLTTTQSEFYDKNVVNPDLPKLKKKYMTKENPNRQNVFDRLLRFFPLPDKEKKPSPKISSSNSETASDLELDLEIERKLNRPYRIGDKFVLLKNFPEDKVFRGNICTISQIYFDWSKYTENEGHSYLVEVQFSSSDFETFDDIVLLYVEYDDLLRLEYQNLVKMNIPESDLKRKNLK